MSATATSEVFDLLQQQAAKQRAAERLSSRIGDVRRKMIFGGSRSADMTFWATLALRLKVEASYDLPTMATDGKRLVCNPLFVESLTDDELLGVMVHEVAHNAMSHHCRRGERDPKLWNVAADLAINPIVLGGGFTLPPERLMPGEGDYSFIATGQSAEAIYSQLLDQQGGASGSDGAKNDGTDQGGDPGQCGGVIDPGDGSHAAASEAQAEAQVAVAQAQQAAKQRGAMSDGLQRAIDAILNPTVDWREVLRDFVTKQARNDYRWTPPNRRFVWSGLYLPSISGESIGEIVIAVDTSGSVGDRELAVFGAEISGIASAYDDAELTILYHDSDVKHVQKWSPHDGPLVLEPKGGGGTSHIPVFAWVTEDGMEPACMVCLTDLYSEFPKRAPDYPVLWASVSKGMKGPWGRTVEID